MNKDAISDATSKGIKPGETVDIIYDGATLNGIYIGKIPQIRVHSKYNRQGIATDGMNIRNRPWQECDYDTVDSCPVSRGCIWGGKPGQEFCHNDFDVKGLKVGDLIPDDPDSDKKVKIQNIEMKDAVYTHDEIIYVQPGPFGKQYTIRKQVELPNLDFREFQDCGNLYPYVSELYKNITRIGKVNTMLQHVFGSVKSGGLTGKIRTINNRPHVQNISGYTNLLTNIYSIIDATLLFPREKICVYRAMSAQLEGEGSLDLSANELIIPLPASCSINLGFVHKWLKDHGTLCCLLKIHLDESVPYLPMELPTESSGQDEILIPAGIVHISHIYMTKLPHDGRKTSTGRYPVRVIEGKLEPWNLLGVKEYAAAHPI